jgi:hypothetical protein
MAGKKGASGGARENAGRKPKADEIKLIERLSVYDDVAQQKLFELIDDGDFKAIQLFYAYRYGKPKETVNMTVQEETPIINVE